MIRIPGKIPIAISPLFWIFAALIGYLNSMSLVGTLIWMGIIVVSVLFHEFGHLLHHCLTRVEVRGLAGTNVAWDFVELPSQILENWCTEEQALNLFARHYETGETLPVSLLAKLQASKKFRSASL